MKVKGRTSRSTKLCSECKKAGEFTCFCSKIVLCSSCIGVHLTKEPILQHKPVALQNESLTSLMKESWSELQETEAEIFGRTQRRLSLNTAVEEKLQQELADLKQFETLGVNFTQEIVKTTIKQIGNSTELLCDIVRNRCREVRIQLETALHACRHENTQNEIAEKLLACEDIEELNSFKLFNKEIDFNEVNIKQILLNAFSFNVSSSVKATPTKARFSEPLSARWSVGNTSLESNVKQPRSRLSRLAQPKKQVNGYVHSFDYSRGLKYTVNVLSGDVKTADLPKQEIGMSGSVCTHVNGSIMITGGLLKQAKNTVWAFDISKNKFQICPSMKNPRYCHAAVAMGDNLYIFGGFNKNALSECEKYSISQKKWQKIPSLQTPRYKHSAVCFNERIFVVGGAGESSIEVFNPLTNAFSYLRVALPTPGPSISLEHSGSLILLCQDEILTLDNEASELCELNKVYNEDWWTSNPPVVYGKHAFFIKNHSLWKISLEDGVVSCIKSIA